MSDTTDAPEDQTPEELVELVNAAAAVLEASLAALDDAVRRAVSAGINREEVRSASRLDRWEFEDSLRDGAFIIKHTRPAR